MTDNIVSTRFRGRFAQGSLSTLVLNVTRFDGQAVDPIEINFTIKHKDSGTVVRNGSPEKAERGLYVVDWPIEKNAETGIYQIIWSYDFDGEENEEIEEIAVAKDTRETFLYSGEILLMKQSLELMLDFAQHIPVYFEQAQPSHDRQAFVFTRGDWNQKSGTRVYVNQNVVTEGYKIDFERGSVVFDEPLTEYDVVNADYNFRWFNDQQLERFLENGVQKLNIYPPHTRFSVGRVPDKYVEVMLYGAVVDALRSMLLSMSFEEPAQFFGGSEAASKKFSQLESLKKNYEEEWKSLAENKKYIPYAGRTRQVVVPEYTLPGGRSRWFRYLYSGGGI